MQQSNEKSMQFQMQRQEMSSQVSLQVLACTLVRVENTWILTVAFMTSYLHMRIYTISLVQSIWIYPKAKRLWQLHILDVPSALSLSFRQFTCLIDRCSFRVVHLLLVTKCSIRQFYLAICLKKLVIFLNFPPSKITINFHLCHWFRVTESRKLY